MHDNQDENQIESTQGYIHGEFDHDAAAVKMHHSMIKNSNYGDVTDLRTSRILLLPTGVFLLDAAGAAADAVVFACLSLNG